jgi:hypothetical protein
MLDMAKITRVVEKAVSDCLDIGEASSVSCRQIVDQYGEDALQVLVVLPDNKSPQLTGEKVVDLLSRIQDELQILGEQRFAYVDFATENELAADADSES